MRKFLTFLGMGSWVAVLLLGSVLAARADEDGGMGMMGGGEGGGAGVILKMKEKLGLTDQQADRLRATAQKEREEMKPLFRKMMMDLKSLRQAVQDKAKDSELTSLVDRLDGERRSMESLKNDYVGRYRSILTLTQQAKVALWMARQKMMMMKKIGKMGKHKKGHPDGEEEGEDEDH